MPKEFTNSTDIAEALGHMLLPTHKRTTKSAEFWATQFDTSVQALSMIFGGTRPLSVSLLVRATKATGDTLAVEALARQVGGIFLSTPQCEIPASVPLFQQIADTARQGSETLACICEAVRDGVATMDERSQIDAAIVSQMSELSKLRAMVHELPSKAVANVTPLRRESM